MILLVIPMVLIFAIFGTDALNYVLLNVDTSLASANIDLMLEYSKLWPNEQSRKRTSRSEQIRKSKEQ